MPKLVKETENYNSTNVFYPFFLLQTCKQTYITQMCPRVHVAKWARWLDYIATHTSLSSIRRGLAPGFVNHKKGVLDSQPQVIACISCLPMVGGSLRVLRRLPPLKLVAMTYWNIAESDVKHNKSNQMCPTVLFIVLYYECVCIGSKLNLVLFNNEHSFQSFEFERNLCSLFYLPTSFCTN